MTRHVASTFKSALVALATAFMTVSCNLVADAEEPQTVLTIAMVDNVDMLRLQRLSDDFTAKHPEIALQWVTLDENSLRDRVTQDMTAERGVLDVVTIGPYETPIWARRGWLVPLDNLPVDYDVDDLLPAMRSAVSVDGQLYAAPFYGESAMVMYRTDLLEAAGLTMPRAPDWAFIRQAAIAMTDRDTGVSGICLRGKAGWGENMALLTAMANSFGARWFDMDWKPQFDRAEWAKTLTFYLDLMAEAGPPNAAANGYSENLELFQRGQCGIWIDATVAASFVTDPAQSAVAQDVGFALAPGNGLGKRADWLWVWSLAIPANAPHADAAKAFIVWATSKHYAELVAAREGWANAPPATRTSLYKNPTYATAAPFASITFSSIHSADPRQPTVSKVPYMGIQYVDIPEFQAIGTKVGAQFASALAGHLSARDALSSAQALTDREMKSAGYGQ